MRRAHARAAALPTELVEASARANSACEKVWRTAKAASDFAAVRPHLEEVVRLQRETASALSAALGLSPYDALMDGYQPGVTAAEVEPVFTAYGAFLAEALPRAEELQARRPAPTSPSGPFPVPAQRALCQRLSERVGLDYAHARLDESLHPFCGGTPTDIRITTFYSEGTSRSRCSASCTRPATPSTSAACPPNGRASRWARRPAWPRTSRRASSSRCRPAAPTPSCASSAASCTGPSAATARPTARRTSPACGAAWSAASSAWTPTS
jgi:carboxypeptidase Taq